MSHPDSPFESFDTYEVCSLSSAGDMSQSSPQAIPSSPAHVSEWVEQQSLTIPEPTDVVTMPSPNDKSTAPQRMTDSTIIQTSAHKVYDIATLVQLQAAKPMEHMELRIHPSALAGKPISLSTFHAVT